MNTKDNMITDISAELEKEFGVPGTPERAKFDEEAYAFYTGQILLEARREAKVTQSELAKRINATKSYISRIENGSINPSVGTFYRIMNALGLGLKLNFYVIKKATKINSPPLKYALKENLRKRYKTATALRMLSNIADSLLSRRAVCMS